VSHALSAGQETLSGFRAKS